MGRVVSWLVGAEPTRRQVALMVIGSALAVARLVLLLGGDAQPHDTLQYVLDVAAVVGAAAYFVGLGLRRAIR